MSTTPSPEERAAALKWLDAWERCGWPPDMRPARTLKALLARPTVPGICDHKAIDELAQRSGVARGIVALVIEKMHEPPKPATKEIEIELWARIDASGKVVQCGPLGAIDDGGTVVRLTGKATVPASSKGSE